MAHLSRPVVFRKYATLRHTKPDRYHPASYSSTHYTRVALFVAKSKGLFDHAGVKCPAWADDDVNTKKAKLAGYCVITDADGDQPSLCDMAKRRGHRTRRAAPRNVRV